MIRAFALEYCPKTLENGYRVHGRAGRVVKPERAYGQHELPAVALFASLRQLLEVRVVEDPHAHRDDADLVDGIGQRWIPARHHVVSGVATENHNSSLVEQGQAGGLTRG